ncbi:MBG domain-containing protein [Myroides sp. LJL115]
MKKIYSFLTLILLLSSTLLYSQNRPVTILPQNGRVYVKPDASGNGSSWDKAANLADALKFLEGKTAKYEIWVAKGTHKPYFDARGYDINPNRYSSFTITGNMRIYGGFNGDETQLDQRDSYNNVTILSGDFNDTTIVSGTENNMKIQGNDNNALRVLNLFVQDEILIDGVTIFGGNASLTSINTVQGISMRFDSGGAAFLGNYNGATKGKIVFNNVIFHANQSLSNGGVLSTRSVSGGAALTPDNQVYLVSSLLYQNYSKADGGALEITPQRQLFLQNVTISDNLAENRAGALFFNENGENAAYTSDLLSNIIFYNYAKKSNPSYFYSGSGNFFGQSYIQKNSIYDGSYNMGKENIGVFSYGVDLYKDNPWGFPYYSLIAGTSNNRFTTSGNTIAYNKIVSEFGIDGKDLGGNIRYNKSKNIMGAYQYFCQYVVPPIVETTSFVYGLNEKSAPLVAYPSGTSSELHWFNQGSDGKIDYNSPIKDKELPIVPSTSNAGVTKYFVVSSDSGGCESEPIEFTVTVKEQLIKVSANNISKYYAEQDPELTFTTHIFDTQTTQTSDSLSESVKQVNFEIIGSLEREPGENVQEYIISQGSLALSPATSDYELLLIPGIFTIAPGEVKIVPKNYSKNFGQQDPSSFEYTISKVNGVVEQEAVSGALQREPGENVGKYSYNAKNLYSSKGSNGVDNYTFTLDTSQKFEILPLEVVITPIGNLAKTYGQEDPELSYSVNQIGSELTLPTDLLQREPGENAGDYNFVLKEGFSMENITFKVDTTSKFTINPAPLSIKATDLSKYYGQNDPELTYTITQGELFFGDTLQGKLSRETGQDAGNYNISKAGLTIINTGVNVESNYTVNFENGTLTIEPEKLLITAEAKSKVFNTPDPVLTYKVDGTLYNQDSLQGELIRVSGENVGTYAIEIGSLLAPSSNYHLAFEGANLQILAASFENLELNTQNFTYDGQTHTLEVEGDLPLGTTVTYSYGKIDITVPSVNPPSEVGTYTVKATVQNPNYIPLELTAQMEITKADITDIELKGETFPYDGNSKSLLVTGNTAQDNVTYQGNDQVNVGVYKVEATVTRNNNFNTLTLEADLEITPVDLQGLTFNDVSVTYTGTPISMQVNGALSSDQVTYTYTQKGIEVTPVNPGVYQAKATVTRDENHNVWSDTATLTITPKNIDGEVFLQGRVVTYDGQGHGLEFTGDLPDNPQSSFTYTNVLDQSSTTNQMPVNAGTYNVVGTLEGDNVAQVTKSATLVIEKADIGGLSIKGRSEDYEGTPLCLTLDGSESTDQITSIYTSSNGYTSVDCPVDVGVYTLTSTVYRNENYNTATVKGTLEILPAPITGVYFNDQSFVYDGEMQTIAFTGNVPSSATASFSYKDSNNNPMNNAPIYVGVYNVEGVLDNGPNYITLKKSAKITITKAPLTVRANDKTSIYGQDKPELDYTITQGKLGQADQLIGNLQSESSLDAGDYPITQGTLHIYNKGVLVESNYDFTFIGANYTIKKASVQINATPSSKVYSANDPLLTYTQIGEVYYQDSIQGELQRNPGEDIGDYEIIQGDLSLPEQNYDLTFIGSTFSILPASIIGVSLEEDSFIYDGAAKGLQIKGTLPSENSKVVYQYRQNDKLINSPTDAGVYKASAIISDPNYTTLTLEADMTITPAEITGVELKDQTFQYDGSKKSLEVSGNVLTGDNITYQNNSLTDVGQVDVVALVKRNENYKDKTLSGVLKVEQAPITGLSFNDQEVTYTGENIKIFVKGTTAEDDVEYVYKKDGNTVTESILPGIYTVEASVTRNPNYLTWEKTATLIIKNASSDDKVYLDSKEETYNGKPHFLEVSGQIPPGADITYIYKDSKGNEVHGGAIAAGVYKVSAKVVAQGYNDINLDATLTILQAPIEGVDIVDSEENYEGVPLCLEVIGYLPTDTLTLVYTDQNGVSSSECPINVGVYTLEVTVYRNENYLTQTVKGTLTILPAPIEDVALNNSSRVYNSSEQTIVFTGSIPQGSRVNYQYFDSNNQQMNHNPINVGTYKVQGVIDNGANYEVLNKEATLTITKAPLKIKANNQSVQYGLPDPTLTYTVDGIIGSNDQIQGSLAREVGTKVGDYAILKGTLTIKRNNIDVIGNYDFSFEPGVLNIFKAPLKITADPQTKMYGQVDPVLSYTLSSDLYYQDTIEGKLTRKEGEDVGEYAISAGTLSSSASSNYDYMFIPNVLTITPGTTIPGVSLTSQSFVYDGEGKKLEITGALPSDQSGVEYIYTLNGIVVQEAINAGEYQVEAIISDPNYESLTLEANLIITKAQIPNVELPSQEFTYDGTQKNLTVINDLSTDDVSYENNSRTDAGEQTVQATVERNENYEIKELTGILTIAKANVTGVTFTDHTATYTGKAITLEVQGDLPTDNPTYVYTFKDVNGQESVVTEAINVGTYSVKATIDRGSNYNLWSEIATLSIEPVDGSETLFLDPQTFTYDGNPHELEVTGEIPINAFIDYTYSDSNGVEVVEGPIDAGTYQVEAIILAPGFTTLTLSSTLTIDPAPIQGVDVIDSEELYEGKSICLKIDGLLEGDEVERLYTGPNGYSSVDCPTDVGQYTLTVTVNRGPNYQVGVFQGTLNITPAPIDDVTLSDATFVYNKQGQSILVDGDVSTDQVTYTYFVGDADTSDDNNALEGAPVNVGTYIVRALVDKGSNYQDLTLEAQMVITPAPVHVWATASSKVYGDNDPAFYSYTSEGLMQGDSFTGELSRVPGENAGVYAILQSNLTAGDNYNLTYSQANFTIQKAPLKVIVSPQGKVYGEQDPYALRYTISGRLPSHSIQVSLERAQGEDVGEYPITLKEIVEADNYTVDYQGENFTITPAELTITANAKNKIYGQVDPELDYSVSGFVRGDTDDILEGSLTRNPGKPKGVYPINRGTVALVEGNDNYEINYIGNNLVIGAAKLIVTPMASSKIYGQEDKEFLYKVEGLQYNELASQVFTGALSREQNQDVGDYPILQGTLEPNANYEVDEFNPALFTISPATLEIKAVDQNMTYGQTIPELTYQARGWQYNDSSQNVLSGQLSVEETANPLQSTIIQGSLVSNNNYTIDFSSGILRINAAELKVTANNKSVVYGASEESLDYTVQGLVNGDTKEVVSGELVREKGDDARSYVISRGSLESAPYYSISFTPGTYTITPAPLTISAKPAQKTYGQNDPVLSFSVEGLVNQQEPKDALQGVLTRVEGEDVGSYAIGKDHLYSNENYSITTFNSNVLTITKAELTVKADNVSKEFGQNDPAFTYQVDGLQLDDSSQDVLKGELSREPGEALGDHTITQGTLEDVTGNYTIDYTPGILSITPGVLTVKADDVTLTYGTEPVNLPYSVSGLLPGQEANSVLSGSLSSQDKPEVGSHVIEQGSLTSDPNYTIVFEPGELTVEPKGLVITADNHTKVYGQADKAFTYQVEGLVYDETKEEIVKGVLTRDSGPDVGQYIIHGDELVVNKNYTIQKYVEGKLTITPAPLKVWAEDKTSPYAQNKPPLTYGYNKEDLVNQDIIGDVIYGSLKNVTQTNVGTYPIEQGTLKSNKNYTMSFTNGKFTITPLQLKVEAQNTGKIFGEKDPELNYLATGFASGDSEGNVLEGALARESGEDIGEYAILQGSLKSNANYIIAFEKGEFHITEKQVTVLADAQSKVYGQGDPELTYVITGLQPGDSVTGKLEREEGENVGTYKIVRGTLEVESNYSLVFIEDDFDITAAELTVVADSVTKLYANTDPVLTYTVEGFQNGDTKAILTGNLEREGNRDVGVYFIEQGTLSAGDNYSISFTHSTFTILKSPLYIHAIAHGKVYGQVDPVLDYQYQGVASWDKVDEVLKGKLTRKKGEDVGEYSILEGSLETSDNYELKFDPATFTIESKELVISAIAAQKVYGQNDPVLKYNTQGLVFNQTPKEVLTGDIKREEGEDVGKYSILKGDLSSNNNYYITYKPADFTITQSKLIVSANPQTKTYADADPILDYTVEGLQNQQGQETVFTGSLSRQEGENVGKYSIVQGDLEANGNYSFEFVPSVLNINPAALTLEVKPDSKVYGSPDPSIQYTVTGLKANDKQVDVLKGSLYRQAGENVGDYPILEDKLVVDKNYYLDFKGADLSITPAELVVSAVAKTKVYGSIDPGLTYLVSGLTNKDKQTQVLSGGLEREPGQQVNVYNILIGSLKATPNYKLVYKSNTFEITPKKLIVEANNQSKVFDTEDPILTFETHGFEYSDSTLSVLHGSLERDPGEVIDQYAIRQGSLGANANYIIDYLPGVFYITPNEITVTANAAYKVYGQQEPVLSYSISGITKNDALVGELTREQANSPAGENVGRYVITQGTLVSREGNKVTFIEDYLDIVPAELTIVADAQSQVYGQTDKQLSFQVQGLENGDTESVITGSLEREPGLEIGTYLIEKGSINPGNNYTFEYSSNYLTITKAALTIQADGQSKMYGQADPILTYKADGLVYQDTLEGNLTRVRGNDVGEYSILQGSLVANNNYDLTYQGAKLLINPASLKIVVDHQTKTYGQVDPELTYEVEGMQYDQSPDQIVWGNLLRDQGEDVGSYVIGIGTLESNSNYQEPVVVSNTLEIVPLRLDIQAQAQEKIYGEIDPVLTYEVSEMAYEDKLTGSLERSSGENVGKYTINQGSLTASGNYAINFSSNELSITPSTLKVKANNQLKVYSQKDPVLSYEVQGLQFQDLADKVLSGKLDRAKGENVGKYAITQGSLVSNGNYKVDFSGAQLQIVASKLIVLAENGSKIYGQKDPVLTYSVSGIPTGESSSSLLKGSLERQSGEDVGSYPIEQGTLEANANYDLEFIGSTFQIRKADQQIVGFDSTIVVDINETKTLQLKASATSGLAIEYSYQDKKPSDVASGTIDGLVTVSQVGSMKVTATQKGNHNYNAVSLTQDLIVEGGNLEIDKLIINGEVYTDVSPIMRIPLSCLQDQAFIEVEVVTDPNTKVTPGKDFKVAVVNGQPVSEDLVITLSTSSGLTKEFTIEFELAPDTSNVLMTKYDNLIFINNNPLTNGGFQFKDFQIFKNQELIASGQVYSAGQTINDVIDRNAEYSAILTTLDGEVIHTCEVSFDVQATYNIEVAPNPVRIGEDVSIRFDFPSEHFNGAFYQLYTIKGQLVASGDLQNTLSQVNINNNLTEGLYFLVLRYNNKLKSFTLMVKK